MSAVFLKSITDLKFLPDGNQPQVALVGRSNVGKSSLINRLTQQKGLARVSATPGHTQTINFYKIDNKFFLVDLPGYGFAKISAARRFGLIEMIHEYLSKVSQLKLALLIIDARLGPTDLDREMLVFLALNHVPTVMIMNKMDKLTHAESAELKRTLTETYPHLKLISHSIKTSQDRGEILGAIEEAVRRT